MYIKSHGEFSSFSGEVLGLGSMASIDQLDEEFGPAIKQKIISIDNMLGKLPAWKCFRYKNILIHAEYSEGNNIQLLTFSEANQKGLR